MTSLHHKSLHSSRRTLSCNSLSALRPASGRQIIHHRLRQSSYGQSCSSCPYRFFSFARGGIACSSQQNPRDTPEGRGDTAILLAMGALVLAVAVTVGYPMVADQIEDLIYSADSLSGAGGFGPADVVAGLLWGLSLFFASPLQQLLLFLGKIETERPSDWIIMQLARGPLGLDILDVNEAPSWLSYIAAGICLVSGLAISFGLQAGLGDSIWALSTGTGACLAAGVYEVGRPKRLNLEETRQLDQQWRDFVGFAESRLVRSGRCHESEVAAAFRREFPRYRSREALSDGVLRDLIRNWHPDADRTPNGYYRNLSLAARVNAFTGKVEGAPANAAVTPVATGAEEPPPRELVIMAAAATNTRDPLQAATPATTKAGNAA
ncbi:hypothetical protein Vretimale_75 [Volvox reticuliferus]|uniref:Uncharacterized protein n=1 Tax=Volvox reticuliferus TaxID=1737510 RepID=A0A8J4D162_9CHLO|nr:hypothetical protein Vretifemale_8423 [Volvox reticuliferus]GIL93773.1 hypothetical protein Vretimale_75 [Volvox reticuliferus]